MDGWDDDAIFNCLERSFALSDYNHVNGSVVGVLEQPLDLKPFEFVIRSNRRMECETREVIVLDSAIALTRGLCEHDNQKEETSRQDGDGEGAVWSKDFQKDTCKPETLLLPNWASDPETRL